MGTELDPQVRALLDRMAAEPAPPERSIEQMRADYDAASPALAGPGEPVAQVSDRTISGPGGEIPIRAYRPSTPVYQPSKQPVPVLVWLHGGGWMVGSPDSHDALCRRLANRAGCVVVSVHYRLAPEHPFPAALDDALAAVGWVADHADEIGGDASRLAVGGDSSGASIAASVARHRLDVRLQVLVYPATDAAMDTASHERYASGYYLERDEMRSSWDSYLAGADPADPDASPLRADDLAGVAPAFVLVAGFDPLHDEGVAYAGRLQAAGVPVELVEFEGQIHGFLRWLATLDAAGEAADRIATALRQLS